MKRIMIAGLLLMLQSTSAMAGEANPGVPGKRCSTIAAAGCAADCDRAYSNCRAARPYPADAVATRLFRQIDTTGNGSLSPREVAIWGIRTDAAKGFVSGHHSGSLPEYLNIAAQKIAPLDRAGSEAGDGHLAYREAMRFAALFYNQFSGDDNGSFRFPPIRYPSGKLYQDPRNDLTAPYQRNARVVSLTYEQFRRKNPGVSIPKPKDIGGTKLDDSWVSPYPQASFTLMSP